MARDKTQLYLCPEREEFLIITLLAHKMSYGSRPFPSIDVNTFDLKLRCPILDTVSRARQDVNSAYELTRGGSRIFLRRGAPLRNDVTHAEVKKNLKANTCIRRRKLYLRRGVRTPCTLPLDPPLLTDSSGRSLSRFRSVA